MKALVLAAGKSTRIAARASGLPKPLIAVNGRPILLRTLEWLVAHDISPVWINLHYNPESIRDAVKGSQYADLDIRFTHEHKLLGTAGAVKNLEAEWTEPFLLVYGDNLLGFNIADMVASHRASGAALTMALFHWETDLHSQIAGGRVECDEAMCIAEFTEGAVDDGVVSPWVNAGVYVVEPDVLGDIPPAAFFDFGKDLFPALLQKGAVLQGYAINSYCLAADTPAALDIAEHEMRKRDRATAR